MNARGGASLPGLVVLAALVTACEGQDVQAGESKNRAEAASALPADEVLQVAEAVPSGGSAPSPESSYLPRDQGSPVPESLTPELMRDVKRLLKRGDAEGLRPRVPARSAIVVEIEDANCDGDDCVRRTRLRGYRAFAEWLAEMSSHWSPANCSENAPADRARRCHYLAGFNIQGRMGCDAECCRIALDPAAPHELLHLESICFRPLPSGALGLRAIRLTEL